MAVYSSSAPRRPGPWIPPCEMVGSMASRISCRTCGPMDFSDVGSHGCMHSCSNSATSRAAGLTTMLCMPYRCSGAHQSGNFIVGESAYRLWLDQLQQTPECLDSRQLPQAYTERAQRAMQYGLAGSSAAGEFPKFTALRTLAGGPTPLRTLALVRSFGPSAITTCKLSARQ